jgi:hypothetical protein
VQGPEFKPHYHLKKKEERKKMNKPMKLIQEVLRMMTG